MQSSQSLLSSGMARLLPRRLATIAQLALLIAAAFSPSLAIAQRAVVHEQVPIKIPTVGELRDVMNSFPGSSGSGDFYQCPRCGKKTYACTCFRGADEGRDCQNAKAALLSNPPGMVTFSAREVDSLSCEMAITYARTFREWKSTEDIRREAEENQRQIDRKQERVEQERRVSEQLRQLADERDQRRKKESAELKALVHSLTSLSQAAQPQTIVGFKPDLSSCKFESFSIISRGQSSVAGIESRHTFSGDDGYSSSLTGNLGPVNGTMSSNGEHSMGGSFSVISGSHSNGGEICGELKPTGGGYGVFGVIAGEACYNPSTGQGTVRATPEVGVGVGAKVSSAGTSASVTVGGTVSCNFSVITKPSK